MKIKIFLIIAIAIFGAACEELANELEQVPVNEPVTQPDIEPNQPNQQLTRLPTPQNVKATAGVNSVTLTWTVSGNPSVTGYNIQQTVDSNITYILVTGRDTASHTITGLTANKEYSYAITAVAGSKRSTKSAEVTVTVKDRNVSVILSNTGSIYYISAVLIAEGTLPFTVASIKEYNKLPVGRTLTDGNTHKVTVKCGEVMSIVAIGLLDFLGSTYTQYWPRSGASSSKGQTHIFACGSETTIHFRAGGVIQFEKRR